MSGCSLRVIERNALCRALSERMWHKRGAPAIDPGSDVWLELSQSFRSRYFKSLPEVSRCVIKYGRSPLTLRNVEDQLFSSFRARAAIRLMDGASARRRDFLDGHGFAKAG